MASNQRTQTDFAIVGAGLAGLRAALDLSQAGHSVLVFEARERVGGRTLTSLHPDARPLILDMGGQWVGPGQTEILGLIRDLGLQLLPTEVPGRTTWVLDGRVRRTNSRFPPVPPGALADLLLARACLVLMCRQIPRDAPWQAPRAKSWDNITVEEWIRGQYHTLAGRTLACLNVTSNIAVEPRDISLLGLLFDIRSTGSIGNVEHAESFRIREGAHEIAVLLARRLGERVVLGAPVHAITQDGEGATVHASAATVRCRRVVLCVPPVLAAQIAFTPPLASDRAELMARLPMSSSVKFHAVYPRPFWRGGGDSGRAFSASHMVTVTYDNSPRDGSNRGVLVGLVVADQAKRLGRLTEPEQRQAILATLHDLFGPEADDPEMLLIQDWSREEWTRGCYAAHFPPTVWTTLGHTYRTPTGRIHWAGTETSPEWHGYMEGALRSGRRVAREMLRLDAARRGSE